MVQSLAEAHQRGQQQGWTGLAEAYKEGNRQLNAQPLSDKARIFANDLTFNLADPVLGALDPTSTIAEQHRLTEEARSRSPVGFSLASGLLGGTASGVGLGGAGLTAAKFAPEAGTLGADLVRGGVNAAEQAALSGISSAARGDDWSKVAEDAAIGGGLGLAGSAIGGIAGRKAARSAAEARISQSPFNLSSEEQAFERAGRKYEAVKTAGGVYPQADAQQLRTNIDTALADETLDPELDKRVLSVQKSLRRDLRGDISPEALDKKRQWIKEKLVTGVKDDNERRLGRKMMDEIDDFTTRTDVMTPSGPSAQVNQELREGRTLWAKGKRAERLSEAADTASKSAESTGSAFSLGGGNLENRRRQLVKALLDKSEKGKLPSAYSPEESAMLNEISSGTFGRDVGRIGAAISPLRGGLQSVIMGAGAIPTYLQGGIPALAGQTALAIGGEAAAGLGRRATTQAIEDAKRLILTGINPRGDPATVNAGRDLLARVLAGSVRGYGQ
jgi:hypothetical protein